MLYNIVVKGSDIMSQKSYDNSPTLYLIPTPIGNLDDITLRAVDTLKKVKVIFCEDTRITRQLLNHLGINKKLIASHKFNEETNGDKLLKYLESGDVGLVTDRGKISVILLKLLLLTIIMSCLFRDQQLLFLL